MIESTPLIIELEETLKQGNPERRVEVLRKVTNLFLDDADRLSERQIRIFDDVLVHLIDKIEAAARVQLSETLAPIDNAPREVIRRLAYDKKISVAGPVLANSSRLDHDDLLHIAKTAEQSHLLAISERRSLTENLTDILVDRGDRKVVHSLAGNSGARFSPEGYTAMVRHSEKDESLIGKLGGRLDIPISLLRELLARATQTVRDHLMRIAPPEALQNIQLVLAEIAKGFVSTGAPRSNLDIALEVIKIINAEGKLTDDTVLQLARERKIDEVIAALSIRCGAAPDLIAKLMRHPDSDSLMIACKAAHLEARVAREILENRFAHHHMPLEELTKFSKEYRALSAETAKRTLRFMQVHKSTKSTG
jgi:uncharacterized protein (DUF2336 family)